MVGLLGTLGSLNVLLSADTAQFSSAMDKAAYVAEKNLARIGFVSKASLTTLAITLALNVKNSLAFADSIGHMSERVGMSTKQLSVLAYAAKMSDIDMGSLEMTIKKMSVSAFNSSAAFTALGVKVKDSSGNLRSSYDIFVDTAEAFKNMPDGVGKSAAAVAIFGKSGTDIIPLLNSGKEGIAAFAQEAKNLGVVVDDETAKMAERFDQFIKQAQEGLKGFGFRTIEAGNALADFVLKYVLFQDTTAKATENEKNLNQELTKKNALFEKATAEAERKKKLDEEGTKLTDTLRTAQETYNDSMSKYGELLAEGSISEETYERGMKKANQTLSDGIQKTNKFKDAAKDLGFTFQSAFEDAIINGDKLSDVLVGLLKDIERIILRTAITEPLANGISSALSGLFSGGGSTVTGGVGGTNTGIQTTAIGTGPTWSPYPSAHGNIFSAGNLIPFANGGLITRPSIFPMANGGIGLAGESGTEGILPLFRASNGDLGVKSAGKGGGVEINVYAPAGSSVSQNSQKLGDMEQINIMIDEAMSGHVKNPASKTYKTLKSSFGLKQALTVR